MQYHDHGMAFGQSNLYRRTYNAVDSDYGPN